MTPNVLIDTDVILDVFLDREPHNKFSKAVMVSLGRKRFHGHITATIVVNVFYHVRKHLGKETAIQCVRDLLNTKEIDIKAIENCGGKGADGRKRQNLYQRFSQEIHWYPQGLRY